MMMMMICRIYWLYNCNSIICYGDVRVRQVSRVASPRIAAMRQQPHALLSRRIHGCGQIGPQKLHSVLESKAEYHENRKLGLQVQEAIVAVAMHLYSKTPEQIKSLDERHVVENEIRIDEFENQALHEHVLVMLALRPVVL